MEEHIRDFILVKAFCYKKIEVGRKVFYTITGLMLSQKDGLKVYYSCNKYVDYGIELIVCNSPIIRSNLVFELSYDNYKAYYNGGRVLIIGSNFPIEFKGVSEYNFSLPDDKIILIKKDRLEVTEEQCDKLVFLTNLIKQNMSKDINNNTESERK